MSTPNALLDRGVGTIAAELPGASAVFRRFGIDFCCHGDVPLAFAADKRELGRIVDALDALDAAAAPAAPRETDALIDHIQTRYHAVHRVQVPELIALARKVEAVHTGHPEAPAGLADLLEHIRGELEVHMKKEELVLFPAMRRHAAERVGPTIAQMRFDHDDHGDFLGRLAQLTGGFTPPEGACRSWQALYAGAARFAADLMEHVHLENNVLFPRFEPAA